jgi:3-hydroxyisobutyrate dehydrogenase
MQQSFGFIGLGNMGAPMATNLAAGRGKVAVYDKAGTASRAPQHAECCASVAEVAAHTNIIFLSLPTVASVEEVTQEIIAAKPHADTVVVDTSTTGPELAKTLHQELSSHAIDYIDAPISGQAFRAREGSLTFMVAASAQRFAMLRPALETMGTNIFHVGTEPGHGQLMKLVNNYLSISSFVTSSEALACGVHNGLNMEAMLDVVNASTGQNFTTTHVFPRNILSGTYDMNAAADILTKDLGMYVERARSSGASTTLADASLEVIREFVAACPHSDQSEIYKFVLAKCAQP